MESTPKRHRLQADEWDQLQASRVPEKLLKAPGTDTRAWKLYASEGATCPKQLLEELHEQDAKVLAIYGLAARRMTVC